MATLAQSVAGTTLSISATLPATYDAVGFAAVSYTVIAEVTDMGSFGREYAMISHTPVGDRNTYKLKGNFNNGSLAVKMAKAQDVGQALLVAASTSDADYTFMFTFQDGRNAYMTGKCMSYITSVGSVNQILGADAKIEITSSVVETA